MTAEKITTYYGQYTNLNKTDRNNQSVDLAPLTRFNKFASEIKHRGVAKQCNYLLEITPPPFIKPDAALGLVHLFCDQVMFPEMALATTSIKDYGLTREVVYDKLYGSVTASFICDQDMVVKNFFDAWISGTVHRKGGVFAYPNRYIAHKIKIHQLDARKNVVYSVVLNRVTLKVVNDIILGANARDINRVQVQFAYESWDSLQYKGPKDPFDADSVSLDHLEQPAPYDETDIGWTIIEDTAQKGDTIDVPVPPTVDIIDSLDPDEWVV